MAPSRGVFSFQRAARPLLQPSNPRRYSDFVRSAADISNKVQIYISRSDDPYLNLSIEHYLLGNTPTDSRVLFLYSNRPSIVIGRNQNPWIEANLGLIRNDGKGVKLVRRRSGGGTVFHDEGNVNYCVICPTPEFNRDKHAEMVVRALQNLGVRKTRVNERHDIVVDKRAEDGDKTKTYKVSGSAYKLTRLRSLHHGTCLLSSPNLHLISRYLKAPAKPFITARGVESVSSPVTNVGLSNESFEQAVTKEFSTMYGPVAPVVITGMQDVPEILKGLEELKSENWIYCQTPQFTFSTLDGDLKSWNFPQDDGATFTASIQVRHGLISSSSLSYTPTAIPPNIQSVLNSSLLDQPLHKITNWATTLENSIPKELRPTVSLPAMGLNQLFGTGNLSPDNYLPQEVPT